MSVYTNSHSARADYYGMLELYEPGNAWFLSQRRCPVCGPKQRMLTNGNGDFRCEICKVRDHKEVQPLIDAGLDYLVPARDRNAARVMGEY